MQRRPAPAGRRSASPCRRRRPAPGPARRSPAPRTAPASRKRSSALAGWTFTSSSSAGRSRYSATTGMPAGGDHVAIGDAHRGLQHRVGDRPAVHRQRLRRAGGAGHRRRARRSPPGAARRARRAPAAAPRRRPARASAATRAARSCGGRSNSARPSLSSRNATPGRGQRQAAHRGLGVVGLGARVLEELAPRRAWRRTGRAPRRGCPARRRPARRRTRRRPRRGWRWRASAAGRAGDDGQPRRRADRGQRLAAEAERGDAHQVVVGSLEVAWRCTASAELVGGPCRCRRRSPRCARCRRLPGSRRCGWRRRRARSPPAPSPRRPGARSPRRRRCG